MFTPEELKFISENPNDFSDDEIARVHSQVMGTQPAPSLSEQSPSYSREQLTQDIKGHTGVFDTLTPDKGMLMAKPTSIGNAITSTAPVQMLGKVMNYPSELLQKVGVPENISNATNIAVQGLLPLGINKLAKFGKNAATIGAEGITGVPKRVIKNYAEHKPLIEEMKAGNGEVGLAKQVHEDLKNTITDFIQTKGQEVGNAIKQADGSIDLARVSKPFDDAIEKLQVQYDKFPNSINESKLNTLKTIKDDIFKAEIPESTDFYFGGNIKPITSNKNYYQLAKEYGGLKDLTTEELEIIKGQGRRAGTLKGKFGQGIDQLAEELESQGLLKVPNDRNKADYLLEKIANKETVPSMAEYKEIYAKPNMSRVTEIEPEVGFSLQRDLKKFADFADKPSLESRYAGLSQTDKEIKLAASKAYGELNKQFDTLTDGLSTEAKANYSKLQGAIDKLEPLFTTPEQTYRSLKTLNNPSKKMIRSHISDIDKQLGTDLGKKIDLMESYAYMGNPSLMPLSTGGVTATVRGLFGGGIGALLGHGNPYAAAAGASATSPMALKGAMDMGMGLNKIMSHLPELSSQEKLILFKTLIGDSNHQTGVR